VRDANGRQDYQEPRKEKSHLVSAVLKVENELRVHASTFCMIFSTFVDCVMMVGDSPTCARKQKIPEFQADQLCLRGVTKLYGRLPVPCGGRLRKISYVYKFKINKNMFCYQKKSEVALQVTYVASLSTARLVRC
jgi:hypothetical protein